MQLSFVSGRFAGIIQDEKLQKTKTESRFSGLCFVTAVQDIQACLSPESRGSADKPHLVFRSLLDANHAHSPVNAPVRIPLMVSIGR